MQKVMTSIAFMFAIILAACQTNTTTNGAKLNETTSVANNRADPGPGREFRVRSGISCKAWSYDPPTFADEISKHFSSQYQRNIYNSRRDEANWIRLCNELPSVKTKNEARSWLKKRQGIARESVKNHEYWIENPWNWSDAEEAKIWNAFLCRRGHRSVQKVAQVTAEVIAENNPWNATRAKKKAQSIEARVSNMCSRGYNGVEKKFVSESKSIWESYLSLWRLG